jgi:hypothetical protein
VELGTGPGALAQSLHAAHEDVGTQAPDVTSEGGNSAVGGDEQGEDVEPIEAVPRLEPRVGARGRLHERQGLGAVPAMTVDAGTALRIECPSQTEQAVLAPGRTDAFGTPYTHDAVAGNAGGFESRRVQRLSRQ